MATIEFLDDERTKLWAEIASLKERLESAVVKLSQVDNATTETFKVEASRLGSEIDAVRKIAESKTPEDVQTASRAAREALKHRDEIMALRKEMEEFKDRLSRGRKGYEQIRQRGEQADSIVSELEKRLSSVRAMGSDVDAGYEKLCSRLKSTEEFVRKMQSDGEIVRQNSQQVATLSVEVKEAVANAAAAAKRQEELKEKLTEIEGAYTKWLNEAKADFESVRSNGQSTMDKLLESKTKDLNDLTDEIKGLLSGATSVSLSKAFSDRAEEVKKNLWVWALILLLSAGMIVVFGCVSLWKPPSDQNATTIFTRFVIVAGLVIAEEFARRNYSSLVKLSESYAYKAAICNSYYGFKKELGEVDLPKDESGECTPSISRLAETFLDKLGDEPGKRVFEKNRPVFGLLQALTNTVSSPDNVGPAATGDSVKTVSSMLTKPSWPLVCAIAIIAVTIVVALFMIVYIVR